MCVANDVLYVYAYIEMNRTQHSMCFYFLDYIVLQNMKTYTIYKNT